MANKTSDFHYDLPAELIAQTPLSNRAASRLLALDRTSGAVSHRVFSDLPSLLRSGDCLVVNNSKVLPARLLGSLPGGGACELLLLKEQPDANAIVWQCLVKPGKKLHPGKRVSFGDGALVATIVAHADGGTRLVQFDCAEPFYQTLDKLGQMPLPPYIHEQLTDRDRYQTVYAKTPGSAAAPTAGLHFTPQLLQQLRDGGIATADVTLHVGLGTFRPVKAEYIADHVMHSETALLPDAAVETIHQTKQRGGRVIAVGTTAVRVLESFADDDGSLTPGTMDTDIFITPGYRFKVIDGLITNFHLPESTLLMLVSALAGRDAILNAYAQAIAERYRFFSCGDAMLIL